MLKVDGYPPDASQYIQRSSNLVSDVIPGTTLSLVAPGTTTVSIGADINALQTTITTFVNSINFVLDYVKQETKYDATTKTAGTMLGNYSYEIVQQRITDILISKIPGLTDGVDPYTTLAQIGIRTDPDTGKWVIDSTTLNNALHTNLDGVQKLFVKDETTGTKNGVFELLTQEMANLDDSQSGPLNVLLDNYDGIISNIDKNIEREQKRVDLYEQNLKDQFTRLETLLGQLTQQQTTLTNFINQLNGITPGTSTSSTSSTSSSSG
jgi:flagellar hook-associated protein 2